MAGCAETARWNDVETDSDELTDDTTGAKHVALANEVLEQLEGASPSSTFRLASGAGTVKLDRLVGMLARKEMLSDMIIDFAVICICDALGDCYALDTYAATCCCPDPPQTRIWSMHYVVLPVYLSNIHWGVIIVSISTRLNHRQSHPTSTSLCVIRNIERLSKIPTKRR